MTTKMRVTVLILGAAVLVIVSAKMFLVQAPKPMDSVAARSKGNLQAKVQIIEFIDFECPACAAGAQIIKEYMDKYPKDIRLQLKYFPLVKTHRHAMQVALYSECAGQQGKFWPFHELLMPAQKQWSPLISAEPMFNEFIKQTGINRDQLAACVGSDKASKVINDDRTLGGSLGVQSTPTYFINNKMVVGGKSLKEELESYFPKS